MCRKSAGSNEGEQENMQGLVMTLQAGGLASRHRMPNRRILGCRPRRNSWRPEGCQKQLTVVQLAAVVVGQLWHRRQRCIHVVPAQLAAQRGGVQAQSVSGAPGSGGSSRESRCGCRRLWHAQVNTRRSGVSRRQLQLLLLTCTGPRCAACTQRARAAAAARGGLHIRSHAARRQRRSAAAQVGG